MDSSEACSKPNQPPTPPIIPLINAIIATNAITTVATPAAIFSPVIAPVAAASIMLFGGVSVKERLLKETCEDSVAGLNRRANKIPPGIAINDAASKYSTGTPSAA